QAAGDDLVPLARLLAAHQVLDAATVAVLARLAAQDAPPAGARHHHLDRRARVDEQHDVRGVPRHAVDAPDDPLGGQDRHAAPDGALAAVELDARHAEVRR